VVNTVGIGPVRLLMNNPDEARALQESGITWSGSWVTSISSLPSSSRHRTRH